MCTAPNWAAPYHSSETCEERVTDEAEAYSACSGMMKPLVSDPEDLCLLSASVQLAGKLLSFKQGKISDPYQLQTPGWEIIIVTERG